MSDRFWKSVERASWVAGVIGAAWGFYTYLVPLLAPAKLADPLPVTSKEEVQEHEPTSVTPPVATAPASLPQPEKAPTEIEDRRAVAAAFGDLFDLESSNKHIAPDTAGNATLVKRVDKLVVSGDSLVWSYWHKEQDSSEPWVGVSELAYPQPGARNPRLSTLDYSCRAPLRELNPPKAFFEELHLSCAAGECWKCGGTVEYSFDFPKETLDKPHNKIQTHPNKKADIMALVKAIERLQTPGSSYRN